MGVLDKYRPTVYNQKKETGQAASNNLPVAPKAVPQTPPPVMPSTARHRDTVTGPHRREHLPEGTMQMFGKSALAGIQQAGAGAIDATAFTAAGLTEYFQSGRDEKERQDFVANLGNLSREHAEERIDRRKDTKAYQDAEKVFRAISGVSEHPRNWAAKNVEGREEFPEWAQMTGKTVEAVSAMIPSIGVAALTKNPNVGLGVMGVQAGGSSAREAYEATGNRDVAATYGVLSGTAEVVSERMFGGLPFLGKGLAAKLPFVKKVSDKMIAKPKTLKALGIVANRLGEGVEEVMVGLADPFLRQVTFDPDASMATKEDLFEQFTIGVLASTVLSVGFVPQQISNTRERNKVIQEAVDYANELAETIPTRLRPDPFVWTSKTTQDDLDAYNEKIQKAIQTAQQETLARDETTVPITDAELLWNETEVAEARKEYARALNLIEVHYGTTDLRADQKAEAKQTLGIDLDELQARSRVDNMNMDAEIKKMLYEDALAQVGAHYGTTLLREDQKEEVRQTLGIDIDEARAEMESANAELAFAPRERLERAIARGTAAQDYPAGVLRRYYAQKAAVDQKTNPKVWVNNQEITKSQFKKMALEENPNLADEQIESLFVMAQVKSRENPEAEAFVKQANESFAPYGIQVVLDYNLNAKESGYYDPSSKMLHLNGYTVHTEQMASYVVSHEIVHAAQANDPTLLPELKEGAKTLNYDLESKKEVLRKSYEKLEERRGGVVDDTYIEEEALANFISHITNQGSILDQLAQKRPGVLRRLTDFVTNYLSYNRQNREMQRVKQQMVERIERALSGKSAKSTTVESGEVRYALQDDQTGIKDQLRESQNELNAMDPVTNIAVPFKRNMRMGDARIWVINQLKKTGFQVERQGFGRIVFDEKRIREGTRYLETDGEVAAFAALPHVLKRGIEISERHNHKGRQYATVTLAGPVVLNGTRGNMAVVVKRTSDNFYKMHRILAPDGTVFVLPDIENTEPTTVRGLAQKGTHAKPISSASDNSIPTNSEIDNKNISEKTDQEEDTRYSIDISMADLMAEWEAAQAKYGVKEGGMEPRVEERVSEVPEQINSTTKVSDFMRTAYESPSTPEEWLPNLQLAILSGKGSYTVATNKVTSDKAEKRIEKLGLTDAYKAWDGLIMSDKRLTAEDIAFGEHLLISAADRGDLETWEHMVGDLAAVATSAGQAVQAFAMLKKLSPAGRAYTAERYVQRLQDELDRRKNNKVTLKINPDLLTQLHQAKTFEEMERIEELIIKDIAEQIPPTVSDRVVAWRYLAMLGNPRTHIRNIVSNFAMWGARGIKDKVGATIEGSVSLFNPKLERTKTWARPTKEAVEFAKNDFKVMRETMAYGGKVGFDEILQKYRHNFSKDNPVGRSLNFLDKFNAWSLNVEDIVFMRMAYVSAMGHWMKVNNVTPEMLQEDTKKAHELLAKMRDYSVREGLKATYREANSLAAWLNEMEGKNVVNKIIIGGLAPFKKTPINILKRGFEYSPIGLAGAVTRQVYLLKQGDITAAQLIDRIASGLTGSAIFAVGMWLGLMGIVKAGEDDDEKKEEYYNQSMGHQPYSIRIGDTTYTLDWLTPISMPLMAGVEWALERTRDDGLELSDLNRLLESALSSADPLTELSLLQGLNQALQGFEDNKISGALISTGLSFGGQFVPTLAGQVARIADPVRRSTYAPKDTNFPGGQNMEMFINRMKNKTPGASTTSEPFIDIWGNEEIRPGNVGQRVFEQMLFPGYAKPIAKTAVDDEISRVYAVNQESAVLPAIPKSNLAINGKTYRFKPEEYTDFKRKVGQTAYRSLENLFKTDRYQKLSQADKEAAISGIFTYARESAKADFAEKRGIEYSTTTKVAMEKADAAIAAGIDLGTYQIIKLETSTDKIKSDVDLWGNAVTKDRAGLITRKTKVRNYLRSAGLTGEQMDLIMEKLYDYKITPWLY